MTNLSTSMTAINTQPAIFINDPGENMERLNLDLTNLNIDNTTLFIVGIVIFFMLK